MMVLNYPQFPKRMLEIWEWVVALDAYDYGDGSVLAELIAAANPIPPEVLPQIAKIVSGARKPNLKAAAKLKIPAKERMRIAGSISTIIGLSDMLRTRAIYIDSDGNRPAIQEVADRQGTEVIEQVRYLERGSRKLIEESAEDLGVSVETIENLLRDLRRKAMAFPEV